MQQPAIPKYRVPVFEGVAERGGLDLSLLVRSRTDLPNVDIDTLNMEQGPRLRRLPGGLWYNPDQLRAVDPARSDVAVLEWNSRLLSLPRALKRARRRGVRTVLWGHGYSKNEAGWRQSLRLSLGRRADAVLLYNTTMARRCVDEFGFDPDRVHVALNSLDQRPIAAARDAALADTAAHDAFVSEHALGGPTAVFVSRLHPENRADMLIRATAALGRDLPGMKSVIIGGGVDEPRLRALADELGVGGAVIFAGKIYDERELAMWMTSAGVFCYPENIGLSLLHAFGYGLPVITCDDFAAQNPEIEALVHGYNGLAYQAGDLDAMCESLASVLGDDPMRAKLSEGALRTVNERFTIGRMVDGFVGAVRGTPASERDDLAGWAP